MAALLGDGDLAMEYFSKLKTYLHPNAFYSEIGLPVIDTPLHGATALHEMVFQSWGRRLLCFPAVPSTWPETQFVSFRGEGGFFVSASRSSGTTDCVEVVSTYGGEIELDHGIDDFRFRIHGSAEVVERKDGMCLLKTKPAAQSALNRTDPAKKTNSTHAGFQFETSGFVSGSTLSLFSIVNRSRRQARTHRPDADISIADGVNRRILNKKQPRPAADTTDPMYRPLA